MYWWVNANLLSGSFLYVQGIYSILHSFSGGRDFIALKQVNRQLKWVIMSLSPIIINMTMQSWAPWGNRDIHISALHLHPNMSQCSHLSIYGSTYTRKEVQRITGPSLFLHVRPPLFYIEYYLWYSEDSNCELLEYQHCWSTKRQSEQY